LDHGGLVEIKDKAIFVDHLAISSERVEWRRIFFFLKKIFKKE